MKKLLILLIAALLLTACACAEEYTTLRYAPELTGLPANLSWQVYTGPGYDYHIAADGRAKVSTNAAIMCYGRVEGTDWLMIRYFIEAGNSRIGYICANSVAYAETFAGVETLHFQNELYSLKGRVEITDDPNMSKRTIGTVSGVVTLLAVKHGGDWVYIDGHLDGSGEPVRGFIRRTALHGAAPLPQMPMSPFAGDRFLMEKSTALKLADGARAEGMALYPLADGSWLIAYRCDSASKLYLRVISEKGKKLWAKSVDRRYLHQIALTETGFICETFDNSKCDSGMRYTYACKGRKWGSAALAAVEEPDRCYCDNTASYTLRRYPFGGSSTIRTVVTNRAAGTEAEHLMSIYAGSSQFLHEADGELYFYARDEFGGYVVRIYGEDAEELWSVPVPASMPQPHQVITADHARNALYFVTASGVNWQIWRLDRETLTFADAPVTVAVPYGCTGLTALSANAAGTHDVLLQSPFGSFFCQMTADGTLQMHQALPGKVVWITRLDDARLMLVLMDSEGEFHLQYYNVSEG